MSEGGADVALETWIGQKFAKISTWKFLLENFDQVCKVSAKMIFEKRKFWICYAGTDYIREKIFSQKNFLTKNNSGIWYYYFGIFGIPAKFWIPIPGIFGIFGIFSKIPGIGIFPKIPGIFVPGTGIPGMAHPKATSDIHILFNPYLVLELAD